MTSRDHVAYHGPKKARLEREHWMYISDWGGWKGLVKEFGGTMGGFICLSLSLSFYGSHVSWILLMVGTQAVQTWELPSLPPRSSSCFCSILFFSQEAFPDIMPQDNCLVMEKQLRWGEK